MSTETFPLGALLGLTTECTVLSLAYTPDGLVNTREQLIQHVCGEHEDLEQPMARVAAATEVVRQHPWLRGLQPPDWFKDKPGLAYEWAWLDTQEQRHGNEHPVETLPEGWRAKVKLRDFHAHAHDVFSGQVTTVGFDDLPEGYRAHLRALGYDDTP